MGERQEEDDVAPERIMPDPKRFKKTALLDERDKNPEVTTTKISKKIQLTGENESSSDSVVEISANKFPTK